MDYLNKILSFEERNVRVVGTNDDPWFCGRDVAIILGYKDARGSLRDNVKYHNKSSLELIVQRYGLTLSKLNKNDLKTIYIDKEGLNSLLVKSKFNNEKDYKNGVVYIVTTSLYEKKNIYKVGYTYNMEKRLNNLNGARITEDYFYIKHIFNTANPIELERLAHKALKEYLL